ncbi:MAG: signal peptidase II [Spongiibacteraceae bacterium]
MKKTLPMLLDDFIVGMRWYRLALVVVVLDQLTKLFASMKLVYGEPVVVWPVFNLMLAHNQGAAFSFLHDAGGWQRWLFAGLAGVVSIVLVVWIARVRTQKMLAVALALILGGAVGNLIDRLRFGHVVDFLSFHWNQYYFPAFNIADTAITIGAGLMLLDMFLHPEQHNAKRDKTAVESKPK